MEAMQAYRAIIQIRIRIQRALRVITKRNIDFL